MYATLRRKKHLISLKEMQSIHGGGGGSVSFLLKLMRASLGKVRRTMSTLRFFLSFVSGDQLEHTNVTP